MHLKQIREEVGFSIGIFAECLGLKKATYQCYENGSRDTPRWVQEEAEKQLERTRSYWSGMDARFDDELKGRGVPNETRGLRMEIEYRKCMECGWIGTVSETIPQSYRYYCDECSEEYSSHTAQLCPVCKKRTRQCKANESRGRE